MIIASLLDSEALFEAKDADEIVDDYKSLAKTISGRSYDVSYKRRDPKNYPHAPQNELLPVCLFSGPMSLATERSWEETKKVRVRAKGR